MGRLQLMRPDGATAQTPMLVLQQLRALIQSSDLAHTPGLYWMSPGVISFSLDGQ